MREPVGNAPALLTSLRAVLDELDHLRATYALVGGIGLMAWLPPRATTDIDVLIGIAGDDLPTLAKLLARKLDGVASARPIRFSSGVTLQRLLIPRPEGELIIDLILARDGLFASALSRRVEVRLATGSTHVATAEDLLVMKLLADRPQDRADAAQLAQLPGLDRRYTRLWARRLRLSARLARVLPPAPRRRGRRSTKA